MTLVMIALLLISSSAIADEPSQTRQKALTHLLRHDCGSCHGLTRKGGLGSSLLAKDIADKSDDFLVDTILNGRKGTAMPPWKAFMTKAEALWLVQKRLRNFSKTK
ncbi:MAG: cytochrome c [Methylococcales bacterium]|nr:cytochrome c [Methylococcales bacterium]